MPPEIIAALVGIVVTMLLSARKWLNTAIDRKTENIRNEAAKEKAANERQIALMKAETDREIALIKGGQDALTVMGSSLQKMASAFTDFAGSHGEQTTAIRQMTNTMATNTTALNDGNHKLSELVEATNELHLDVRQIITQYNSISEQRDEDKQLLQTVVMRLNKFEQTLLHILESAAVPTSGMNSISNAMIPNNSV